ncbi:glucokinase [Actinomadura cremea]|nr:glucokinase [Actinomadura cremea]
MSGPWLVGDIGGTNARFALVDGPSGAPRAVRALPTREHADLADAALAYLSRHAPGVRPSAACLAVAGPVTGGTFHLTNAGWPVGTPEDVRERLGVPHLEIVNDFAGLAMSLPRLAAGDLVPVGDRYPTADGPLAVVGPGTGLGVGGLVPAPGGGWVPLPGEGGQVDAPAGTDLEVEVVRLLRAERGAATAEYLLSGDGLARIHRYLAIIDGVPPEPAEPAWIVDHKDDARCARTLALFCEMLGSLAGNVALTIGATGGVYLGGGVLPRIADVLAASAFRARFEGKPPVETYLRAIPTALIVHTGPALVGAAMRLARTAPEPARPLESA